MTSWYTMILHRPLLFVSYPLIPRNSYSNDMVTNPYVARYKERLKISEDAYKMTTGFTGIKVSEHPHRALTVVYGRILRTLQKIPEISTYRKCTEQIVRQRLEYVNQETDVNKLADKIGMGQIEEVIWQAECELKCARSMLKHQVWEPLVESPPVDQWKWPT